VSKEKTNPYYSFLPYYDQVSGVGLTQGFKVGGFWNTFGLGGRQKCYVDGTLSCYYAVPKTAGTLIRVINESDKTLTFSVAFVDENAKSGEHTQLSEQQTVHGGGTGEWLVRGKRIAVQRLYPHLANLMVGIKARDPRVNYKTWGLKSQQIIGLSQFNSTVQTRDGVPYDLVALELK
jgi:hypothetical protein